MLVKTLQEITDTDQHIKTPSWDSVRLLLERDGMGFSFHITTIRAGARLVMQYLDHLESVYCISGTGRIQSTRDGSEWEIGPGTIYALDQHDHHTLEAATELVLACVFNPPLTGNEVHDERGSYPLRQSASASVAQTEA